MSDSFQDFITGPILEIIKIMIGILPNWYFKLIFERSSRFLGFSGSTWCARFTTCFESAVLMVGIVQHLDSYSLHVDSFMDYVRSMLNIPFISFTSNLSHFTSLFCTRNGLRYQGNQRCHRYNRISSFSFISRHYS